VVAAGVTGAVYVYQTGPKAKQRTPEQSATLVQVEPVTRSSVRTMVEAMGTVIAAEEVILQPRVSGEIVALSAEFVPGGYFQAGEIMLKIDPRDYALAVEKSKSQVAQAEYDLKMEQGAQQIAKREWELLGAEETASDLDRELALRKPHLAKATAALAAARAAQKEAKLNLERTTIRAPFNCIVTAENVDLGAQVTPQSQLGTLVGTDTYWVKVSVPVDRLKWISFPQSDSGNGSRVRVYQSLGTAYQPEWSGHVLRLLGDLEPQGRMARVLVEVRDPLGLESSEPRPVGQEPDSEASEKLLAGAPVSLGPRERLGHPLGGAGYGGAGKAALLIGSYVNVEIEGQGLDHTISVPRTALRDGDSVWIMNDDGRLDIRDVSIAWRNRNTVVITDGIEERERLVVSDLPAPVAGMKLRLTTDGQDRPAGEQMAYGTQGETDDGP